MTIFVAPTENPVPLKRLGPSSSMPERYGVDYIFSVNGGLWGVQRKEVSDLIASLHDGRLQRELILMKQLDQAILIIEGEVGITTDGMMIGKAFDHGRPWTIEQWQGIKWSVMGRGIWVIETQNPGATAASIRGVKNWAGKGNRSSLDRRPGPIGAWGKADHREFGCHLLQGFAGIGPELAERIYDHFGRVPLEWTVSDKELMEVEGLGKKKIAGLRGALRKDD